MIQTLKTNELSPPSWRSNYNFPLKDGKAQAECFIFEDNFFYTIINCIVLPTLILSPR